MQTIYKMVKNIFVEYLQGSIYLGVKKIHLLRPFSFTGSITVKSESYEIG